jgi:hypothetical protein
MEAGNLGAREEVGTSVGLHQWMLEQVKANAFIGPDDLAYLMIVHDDGSAAKILLEHYRAEDRPG